MMPNRQTLPARCRFCLPATSRNLSKNMAPERLNGEHYTTLMWERKRFFIEALASQVFLNLRINLPPRPPQIKSAQQLCRR
jgi:hypothetical protein